MQSALEQFYTAIQILVSGFFNLQIVEGVSFGWFVLTASCFAIIIDFLYRKVVS